MKPEEGTEHLSYHDSQKGSFTAMMPLIREARRQHMWLFNKHSGNWYTPNEF